MRLERDARNTAFTWRPRRGPFRRVTTPRARAFDDEGFLVFVRLAPDGVRVIPDHGTAEPASAPGRRSWILRGGCPVAG